MSAKVWVRLVETRNTFSICVSIKSVYYKPEKLRKKYDANTFVHLPNKGKVGSSQTDTPRDCGRAPSGGPTTLLTRVHRRVGGATDQAVVKDVSVEDLPSRGVCPTSGTGRGRASRSTTTESGTSDPWCRTHSHATAESLYSI